MAKIAVIGGAGFIGTNLVRALLDLKAEVIVVDDFTLGSRENLSDLDIQLIEASILQPEKYETSISKCDYVVHLAARGSVPRSLADPEGSFQVNALGTLKILQVVRKYGIPLVFSSSSSVYGKNPELPKGELSWTSPKSPYAASKLAAESLVAAYAESFGIQCSILRFFNVFGPYQRPNHDYAAVIPKWIWSAMHNQELVLEGDGKQTRDFTFVDDVVSVITDLMERKLETSLVNVAFGNSVSLMEIVELLRRKFPDIKIAQKPSRIGDVKHSLNDPQRLRSLFPEIKPTDFVKAFEVTMAWMLENKSKILSLPEYGT